jgi:hydroxylamine reductase (hybrid-cluster protein)
MALIEDTPETEIRTDRWHEMSLGELSHQQELMVKKMSAILQLMGTSPSQSISSLYNALQMGFADLNKLIDYKTSKER